MNDSTSRRTFSAQNKDFYADNKSSNDKENLRQMEHIIKKTIRNCFDDIETKIKEHVDTKMNGLMRAQSEISATLRQMLCKNVTPDPIFPIKTEEELGAVNLKMQNDTELYITTLRNLLKPQGIKKNLEKIIDMRIILEFNVDGVHGKKSFKEYRALFNGMHRAVQSEGMTEETFISDLRTAFKLTKNKYFKNQTRVKKIQNKTQKNITHIDQT